MKPIAWILLSMLGSMTLAASEGAVVTLRDGSSYTGVEVRRFDGRDRAFEVIRGDKAVQVKMSEVGSIDFQDASGMVTLADGSLYSGVIFLEFEGGPDRFRLRRGENAVAVRAAEIDSVDFGSTVLGGATPAIVPVVPIAAPAAVIETEPAEGQTTEPSDEQPARHVSTEEKAAIAERLRSAPQPSPAA